MSDHGASEQVSARAKGSAELPVTITQRALEMAKQKVAEAPEPVLGLRLGVRGGGCSGFSYVIDFAKEARPGRDTVYEIDGLRLVIDRKSAEVLRGCTLDWETRLLGYGFKWLNPSAQDQCGCGSSFHT